MCIMGASDRVQFLRSLGLVLSMPIALDGSKVDKISLTFVMEKDILLMFGAERETLMSEGMVEPDFVNTE